MFSSFGSGNTSFGGGTGFPSVNQNTGGMFGQQQQPAASTSLFGGGFNQAKPAFGATFGAPQNQTTSVFGQQNRLPVPSTGGIFSGQTATVSPFTSGATGTQSQTAGTPVQFQATTGNDTMMKNGVASPISTRHQCITCMKEYENKSLEELRLEDYQLNRKGPQQGSMFGMGVGATQQQQQQNTGMFTGMGSSTTTTPFGQASAFGTNTSTAGGSIFSSLNQPKPTSFFSNPATSATPAFGATNTAFSFSNPTNQTTSVFGAPNNAVSSAGGLGTTSAFSFGTPQSQAATGGLFGAKPAASTSTVGFGSSFGVPTLSNTTATSKPPTFGFGSQPTTSFGTNPAPTFGTGTGSLFGTQNQQTPKPFTFATPFSTQPQASQPSFGSTGGTNFTFTTTTSAPALNFGTSGTTPSFGNIGGGTTNTFGTPGNTFSLGGGLSSTGFGSSFGLGNSSGTGLFSNPSAFSQPVQQQPTMTAPAPVAFASSPYKDSPLFYNLVANRNLDEMIKPTSPAAQRAIKDASRRRASTSISVPNANVNKNVTFPIAKSTSSFNRSIFDGSEEENKGISIDILSPKTSVKKLALKNLRNNSTPNHRHSFSFSSPSTRLRSGFDTFNDSYQSSNENESPRSQGYNNVTSENSSSNKKKSFDESPIQNKSTAENSQLSAAVSDRTNVGDTRRKGCGVTLTRPGYYVEPSLDELDLEVDEQGNCFVHKFVIGRLNHGEIRFLHTVNVAGLNMDEIVHFRHKEVVVYPENYDKPPVGQGLNVPAEISLERVWPIDKSTGDPIKYAPKLQEMHYEEILRKACVRLDAEFVSYTPERGIWTFKVSHFSKYSCDVEETEEESKVIALTSVTKGLGGMPLQQSNAGLNSQKQLLEAPLRPGDKSEIESSGLLWKYSDDRNSKHSETGSKFRQSMTAHSTPISRLGRSLAENVEMNCSEVEHNPLTPSESESDTDWQTVNGRNAMGFDSILNEKSRSSVVHNMMKSVMMMDVDDTAGEAADFQPPIKKSKPNLSRLLTSRGEPSRKERPMEVDPRSVANKLHFVSSSKSVAKDQQQPPVLVARYLPSISKREPMLLKPPQQQDHFALSTDEVGGFAGRPVPRACFGPQGLFLTVSNTKNGNCLAGTSVNILRLRSYVDKYPQLSLIRDTLEEQIDLELFADHKRSLIGQHIGLINTSLKVDDVKGRQILSEELIMWELCEILWPTADTSINSRTDKGFPIKQRIKLSGWMKRHWKYLFGEVDSNEITVLGLLKKGKRRAACELALKSSDYVIAACAAQTLTSYGFTTGGQQLKLWIEREALDFVKTDTVEILKLCGGRIDMSNFDFTSMTTSEWFQYFALYLWYHTPAQRAVDMVVHSFLDFLAESCSSQLRSGEEMSATTLTYPSKPEPSIRNLCVQLLKLYSFMGYPLKLVLDPKIYSADILDYRLSWLLMVNLEKFGYVADEELRNSVTTSFVGQLQQSGLYDRATCILQQLNPSIARDTFSQRILEKNIPITCSPEDQEREQVLSEYFRIPIHPIFSAKLLQANFVHRKDLKILYMLKIGDYQSAYEVLLTTLSLDTLYNSHNLGTTLRLLEIMKPYSDSIRGWDSYGKFLITYLNIKSDRRLYQPLASSLISTPVAELEANLFAFVKYFVRNELQNEKDSAFSLELLFKIRKIVETFIGMDLDPAFFSRGRNEDRLKTLIDCEIPQDYKPSIRSLITRWKKN